MSLDPALLGLLSQIASSPSMRKMSELKALAAQHNFDQTLVEALVPAVTRFLMDAQGKDKLGDAAEFIAHVMASVSEFGPEMAHLLEMSVGSQTGGNG